VYSYAQQQIAQSFSPLQFRRVYRNGGRESELCGTSVFEVNISTQQSRFREYGGHSADQ
jgi:hypothetical protein